MIIFSGVKLVRTAVEILIPPVPMVAPHPVKLPPDVPQEVPPEEMRQRAEEEMQRSRREQRRFATVQMVDSLAMLLIATPLYVYHWRLAQRSEGNPGEANS